MREVDIAMALITQVDVYHLQERTGPKEIGAAGLVGCFGGKIKVEDSETALEAIVRELPEEINITVNAGDLRPIEEFVVDSDHQNEPVKVNVKVFELLLPYGFQVSTKEGELVSWRHEDITTNEDRLTPATKELFRRYFD